MTDSLKQMLIRTPFERPLQHVRHMATFWRRHRHPELADYYAEHSRIEEMVARVLRPDSNCLDVGCHLGSFLSLLLRAAPRGSHMAFEALPEKAERLRRKFPEAQILQGAVGDRPGEVTFFRDLTASGYSGLHVQSAAHATEQVTVACDTLDRLVPLGRQIDFMKVDVEGAELLVLRGARQLIARCRPLVLFECTPDGLRGAHRTAAEVYAEFHDALGYDVMLIKDFLHHVDAGETAHAFGVAPVLTLDAFRRSMQFPAVARNFVATPTARRQLRPAA